MVQRQVIVGIRHGYTGYTKKGCGCDICRAAFREYKQEYNRKKREDAAKIAAGITTITQPNKEDKLEPPPKPGTWIDDADEPYYDEDELPDDFDEDDGEDDDEGDEGANTEPRPQQSMEFDINGGPVLRGVDKDLREREVDESAPGLAAMARRLAVIIDNPLALPQAPAAAARLLDIYKEIGIKVTKQKGKLASVKAMIAPASSEVS